MLIIGHISIAGAIDEIRNAQSPFMLQFVTATGKGKGRLKTVRALYGRSTQVNPVDTTRDKSKSLHSEDGTIPLSNADNRSEYLTPLISHLRAINGLKISH